MEWFKFDVSAMDEVLLRPNAGTYHEVHQHSGTSYPGQPSWTTSAASALTGRKKGEACRLIQERNKKRYQSRSAHQLFASQEFDVVFRWWLVRMTLCPANHGGPPCQQALCRKGWPKYKIPCGRIAPAIRHTFRFILGATLGYYSPSTSTTFGLSFKHQSSSC